MRDYMTVCVICASICTSEVNQLVADVNFGDLVHIEGYGQTPFYIDGWQTTTYYEPEEEWTDTMYDLTNAFTGEYQIAFAEDIKRICGAGEAEEYLKNIGKMKRVDEKSGSMNQKQREPSKNDLNEAEKNKEAESDSLLDEFHDCRSLADAFGEDEYSDKDEQIKIRLSQIVEKKICREHLK